MLRRLLAGLALALVAHAAMADDGWELRKDKDGIQVYSRKVEGWTINEIRAVVRLPARLSTLVAIVDDVPNLPKLSSAVQRAEMQKRDSATRYQYYSVADMPWPVNDRDLLSQREIAQDPQTRVVTVRDTALAEGMPEKKGLVRMVKSNNAWTFTPAGGGFVDVEMRMLADPNGPIPSAVINAMSVGMPLETLEHLRSLAQDEKYANATVAFIQEAPQ